MLIYFKTLHISRSSCISLFILYLFPLKLVSEIQRGSSVGSGSTRLVSEDGIDFLKNFRCQFWENFYGLEVF
jgi:hypothetical protein